MTNNKLKQILTILVIAASVFSMQAQDLIVTQEGDSLNCRITQIDSSGLLRFLFKHKGEIRSTLLPLKQVRSYQYAYYPYAEVPAEQASYLSVKKDYPYLRMALNGGWSYRLGKIPDNISSPLKEYMQQLKSGYHYGIDFNYYFMEQFGAGFKYTRYNASNRLDNIYATTPDNITFYGSISDQIAIDFAGPVFAMRLLSANRRNALILNWGFGYMGYGNEGLLFEEKQHFRGACFGSAMELGYDIGLTKNLAIGFQLSMIGGSLSEIEHSSGGNTKRIKLEKGNYETLTRFDLSAGLRFVL